MARSPITASKEGDVTSANEEALQFDDDNLKAIAEVYKNEGNDEYKKTNFNNAIHYYTKGIKVNCKDEELNAKLYSNRAAAVVEVSNYAETLNDAKIAVDLQPSFLKAFWRGASARVHLERFDEAIIWCDKGLAIAPNNQNLLEVRSRCVEEQRKLQVSLAEKTYIKCSQY
ncbi:Tetratricopeptide repeat protein 4 [Porites harrisoni]